MADNGGWLDLKDMVIEPMTDENGIRMLTAEQQRALSGRYVCEFYTVDTLPDGALVWANMHAAGSICGYFVLTPTPLPVATIAGNEQPKGGA